MPHASRIPRPRSDPQDPLGDLPVLRDGLRVISWGPGVYTLGYGEPPFATRDLRFSPCLSFAEARWLILNEASTRAIPNVTVH